ncbi:MAG: Na/Pi cotransporter family protein, partial [Clostridia bacterium]|nr:Na/Pi cotransporter family protein [Clostridia bacterium]
SVLMSGMQAMSGAMAPLKTSPFFIDFISAVSNPLISLLVGIVVTAIIQSCSASIGILQALSITGIIGYEVAIPMVIGMCIGACVPVLISAMGANVNGRRAAFVYLYFNLTGAVLLMVPFYILHAIIGFDIMSATATSFGIAIVNTIFKVSATVLLAPFSKVLEKIAMTTITDKKGKKSKSESTLLDARFLDYPSLALEQVRKTIDQMSLTAFKNLVASIDLLYNYEPGQFDAIMENEELVDRFEDETGAYLVQLNAASLSEKENQASAKYLVCLGNIERISDHSVNIAELAKELFDKKLSFSQSAVSELKICTDAIHEILDLTGSALLSNSSDTAKRVEPLEQVVDALTKELKNRHVQRVQAGLCTLELGFVYNDCINNFERVADHCSNLAVAVIEASDTHLQSHDYLRTIKKADHEDYRNALTGYANKYYSALDSAQ